MMEKILYNKIVSGLLMFYVKYRKPLHITFWCLVSAAAGTMMEG